MKIHISDSVSATETLIIPFIEQEDLPILLKKVTTLTGISSDILSSDFKAKAKEILPLYPTKKTTKKVILVGLGKDPKQADFIKVFRSFFYNYKKKLAGTITIDLKTSKLGKQVEYIVNGIWLANSDLDLYKTDKKTDNNIFYQQTDIHIIVPQNQVEEAEKGVKIGEATAETQNRIIDLVNQPANKKFPQKIAEFALNSGKEYGFSVSVFDEKQCHEMGLHALLAVGKGSTENPARLIVLEYKSDASKQKIGLVGKGVTFDTGGISIKPSASMSYMKSDMGGAGAVLGTIELAAKLQLPVHLIGVIPCTENCVDGNALKPSDVIDSYAGKTIEVIDTDAEGRLILADGLSYIKKNYEPDVMIDLATLTGNCIAALGYAAAGLLSNNDELADELMKAGQETGEKLWRLPLWDDYKDMMKSDIADIKNLSSVPVAGAITAAKFLEFFIDEHKKWAHIDIAGTAFGDSEFGSMKSATGYGIRLLSDWIRNIKGSK